MPRNAAGDPQWYKDAIIYQTHVRAFADSNSDGIGDFRGLTQKLEYIQELGVSAIWLLPFFPSPLRDGGYDMSNYRDVHPNYGTLKDFKAFLKAAHERGLRVITEMVMNHTSDEHEWFQKSRRAGPGSKWRDYYVWSDTPEKYQEARIIFQDFESSNWSWDPVAQAYFWHRFYSHQPDLNFENPEVRRAMFDAVDFWLEMGIDGLRLDAIPYLFEEEGTNCENLPATHQFLKDLRRHIDEKFEGKMLLAEANQWPEDAAAYFGNGDECHMNFHFPLMPRLYMAVEREDRFPIIDILEQTPALPPGAQWAIFLRNHDELTLEMVTDEERDYMYRAFADDPRARINLGIRRRLAPLMRNDRRKIELMTGLLLSLPGTPVIYYGDEIGMGDNIYLGDRDGVRTPMQWNPDRNAGFSAANPQKLFLPIIIDSEYHFSSVNAEVEQNSPHSLLWWTRRVIHLRQRYRAFGRGTLEFLQPENSKVLAYIREYAAETMLVVANLSRFVQCVELDLSRFRGQTPTELFGQTKFPPVGELPYFLTLGPHSFYWFRLEWSAAEAGGPTMETVPRLQVTGSWDAAFADPAVSQLEQGLPAWLRRHRWFGGKARTVQHVEIEESVPLGDSREKNKDEPLRVVIVRVNYTEGEPERYMLPLVFAAEERARNITGDHPNAALAVVQLTGGGKSAKGGKSGETRTLCEAVWERDFWRPLLTMVEKKRSSEGRAGSIVTQQSKAFRGLYAQLDGADPHVHGGQQSNTSAIFGDALILKLFRKLAPGENPDLEISRFLTENGRSAPVPQMAGAVEYAAQSGPQSGEPMTLAVLHEFVANEGDAWVHTLDELGRYFEHVTSNLREEGAARPVLPKGSLLQAAQGDPPEVAQEMIGPYLQEVALLGRRTAEMHLALASGDEKPNFRPEPFTKLYQRSLYQSMRAGVRRVFSLLRRQRSKLDESVQPLAAKVLGLEDSLVERYKAVLDRKIAARRIRCHGDFHLGQVLYTGKDFVIIDFEGEPDRTISERRIKTSPLKDVAGMLRSFHYASFAARFGQIPGVEIGPESREAAVPWMQFWYAWCAASYLRNYLETARRGDFLPQDAAELEILLDAYVLEKTVYEIGYELNNRPDWVRIPLEGVLDLVSPGG